MLGKLEFLSLTFNIVLLVFILFLIRTKRLRLKYSILWIITVTTMIILSCLRFLLDKISLLVGIYYPPSLLFLVLFLFLLVIVLHYSVEITALSETNKGLVQKLSITNQKLEELRKRIDTLNK